MARHIDDVSITRDALIHRYANLLTITYGRAADRLADLNLEQLRAKVEGLESGDRRHHGERQSFARSQPTTWIDGITR